MLDHHTTTISMSQHIGTPCLSRHVMLQANGCVIVSTLWLRICSSPPTNDRDQVQEFVSADVDSVPHAKPTPPGKEIREMIQLG